MIAITTEQSVETFNTRFQFPKLELNACEVEFIFTSKELASRKFVSDTHVMLDRIYGSSDTNSMDGDLIPCEIYRHLIKDQYGYDLPLEPYATGILFLEEESFKQSKAAFENLARTSGLRVIVWLKIQTESFGGDAQNTDPLICQVVISGDHTVTVPGSFEERVFMLCKKVAASMINKAVDIHLSSLDWSRKILKEHVTRQQLTNICTGMTSDGYEPRVFLIRSLSSNIYPSEELEKKNQDRPNHHVKVFKKRILPSTDSDDVDEEQLYEAKIAKFYDNFSS